MNLYTITANPVDAGSPPAENNLVSFNSGTGIGVSNILADSRLAAIFMSVYNTIAMSSMAGHGGRVLALAGTKMPVRQSCHAPATPIGVGAVGLTLILEVSMPSIALRAICALIPVTTARRLAYCLYLRRAIPAISLVRFLGGIAA